MRKMLYCVAVVSLLFSSLLMTKDHAKQSVPEPSELLRLHVVAQSDTACDQAQKLLVRDAVLELLGEEMNAAASKTDAANAIRADLPKIERTAEAVLQSQGSDAQAKAFLCVEEFPSIAYNGQIVPKGEYLALRIVIGEGQGRNWWCVLFPPLCYADVKYDPSVEADPNDPQELEIRWFLKEWLEERE